MRAELSLAGESFVNEFALEGAPGSFFTRDSWQLTSPLIGLVAIELPSETDMLPDGIAVDLGGEKLAVEHSVFAIGEPLAVAWPTRARTSASTVARSFCATITAPSRHSGEASRPSQQASQRPRLRRSTAGSTSSGRTGSPTRKAGHRLKRRCTMPSCSGSMASRWRTAAASPPKTEGRGLGYSTMRNALGVARAAG